MLNLCHCKLSSCNLRPLLKKKSIKNHKLQKYNHNINPSLPFPKSKPTPLLTNQKTYPLTKLQALEAVLNDLETSVQNGIEINDTDVFASLLETCFKLEAFDHALRVKNLIPNHLIRRNVGISSKLIRMYACSGFMEEAHKLFDQMPERENSAFPWNSLIAGYAEASMYEDALALYFQMVEEGVDPDEYTFPRVLKACGGIGLIQVAEEVHRHVIRYGYWNHGFALNAMVDMYAKCGDIVKARKVFGRIVDKDLVSWNSMLMGYVRHDLEWDALCILRTMICEGHEPDSVTVSALLTRLSSLELGCQIHGWALRHGIEWELSVANSLIGFYSSCGRISEACWLFENMATKDLVSWNSIISAHSKDPKALVYFDRMKEACISPDDITFVSLLSACAHLSMLEDGERLFAMMINEFDIDPISEHYACMVNLYARAGLIDEAYDIVANEMESDEAGATVWGALLYGCFLHGNVEVAEIAASSLFELEPDNEHNFELLMKIYANADRTDGVEKVRRMMVERGLERYV